MATAIPQSQDNRRKGNFGAADNKRTAKFVLAFGMYLVAYHFAYRFGMDFSHETAAPFWFPDSVLLCALLVARRQWWWLLIVSALPIRLLSPNPADLPAWFYLSTFAIDAAKSLLLATVLNRILTTRFTFSSAREFGFYCLYAALLVPLAAAFAGAAARHALGYDYWSNWEQWFLGNSLTQIVITPILFYWVLANQWAIPDKTRARRIEIAALTIGLIASNLLAFKAETTTNDIAAPHFYVALPFLFWAAIRFGMRGATGAMAITTLFAVSSALQDLNPFSGQSPAATALTLQHFLLLRAIPLYIVAIFAEESMTADRSMHISDTRYQNTIDNQRELVCRHDAGTTLTYVNDAFCRFFGLSREQILSRKLSELLPEPIRTTLLEQIRVADQSKPFTWEQQSILPSGEIIWTSWTSSAATDDSGNVREFSSIGYDITDRKRADEANRNLAHASRLAVVGELTAMIAHEIKQPLSAILYNAEAAEMLLASKNPPLQEIREILSDIRKSDLLADESVRNLRNLLRKQDIKIQPIDFNAALADVLRLLSVDMTRRRITLHRELCANSISVLADGVHLQQVLLNLIVNAMDAMSDIPVARRVVTIRSIFDEQGCIKVSVADQGNGIAPAKLEAIFESFYTTKENGMGLGLFIARYIVTTYGGRIWAENNHEGGALLSFLLPVCASPAMSTTTIISADSRQTGVN